MRKVCLCLPAIKKPGSFMELWLPSLKWTKITCSALNIDFSEDETSFWDGLFSGSYVNFRVHPIQRQVDTFHLPNPRAPSCVLRCLWTWWYCHVSILDVQVVPIMAFQSPPQKKKLTVFFLGGGIICFILMFEILGPPPKKKQLRTTKPYIQHNPTGNTCSNL